jgi:hypothetical protein
MPRMRWDQVGKSSMKKMIATLSNPDPTVNMQSCMNYTQKEKGELEQTKWSWQRGRKQGNVADKVHFINM